MKSAEKQGTLAFPYRGIHPFRYVDRAYFLGRETTVDELFVNVLLSRLVLLFGESGTGKSSLINAGLIPALVLQWQLNDYAANASATASRRVSWSYGAALGCQRRHCDQARIW